MKRRMIRVSFLEKLNGPDGIRYTNGGRESASKKSIRRSRMNRRIEKKLTIMYSNVQGYTGKKDSILEIAEALGCDMCLLTETMTTNVTMAGAKCITSKKSVGQNVAVILKRKAERLCANAPV